MTFRRSTATVLGAAALLAVTATTAHAGPPWTVSVGGSSTGAPASYSATSGPIAFTVPGIDLGCDGGSAEGTITPGATSSTAGVITHTTFEGCMFVLMLDMTVEQTSTWNIDIAGDSVGGVTPGEITNVNAFVTDADGLCSFDVSGSVSSSFNENTQQLTVDNTSGPEELLVSNVDGCYGIILEGDPATFKATYELDGIAPIAITN